jgi:CHAT domain-containing protein/Tfp pilus assembly protein PilF
MKAKILTLLLGLFVSLGAVSHARSQTSISSAPRELRAGRTVEQSIRGDETHVYRINVRAEQIITVDVMQKGADVVVEIYDGTGSKLLRKDSPNGNEGPEDFVYAPPAGIYELRVSILSTQPGSGKYSVRWRQRHASAEERQRVTWQVEADAAVKRGHEFSKVSTEEWNAKALEQYNAAAELFRLLGNKSKQAETLMFMGYVHAGLDEFGTAIKLYEDALALYVETNEQEEQLATLIQIASTFKDTARLQKSLATYDRALELARKIGDKAREAMILNNTGFVYGILNNNDKALALYLEALLPRRAAGDKAGESVTLANIATIYRERQDRAKALEYLEQALPLAHESGDLEGEDHILKELGNIYKQAGDRAKASEYLMRSLEVSRLRKDRASEAASLHSLGDYYDSVKDREKAIDLYQQALAIYSELGETKKQGVVLSAIGSSFNGKDQRQALPYLEKAIAIWVSLGERRQESIDVFNLGLAFDQLGEKRKALDLYNRSLAISREIGDRQNEGSTSSAICDVYSDLEEYAKARACFDEALKIVREVKDRNQESTVLNGLGLIADMLGEKHKAIEYYEASVAIARELKDVESEATTLSNLGKVWADVGDYNRAFTLLNDALVKRRQIGDRSGEAGSLNSIGYNSYELGDPRKALEFFKLALTASQESGDFETEALVLGNIGRMYGEIGDTDKALQYLSMSLDLRRKYADKLGEAVTLINIGNVQARLGEHAKALENFERSRSLSAQIGDREREARALNSMARLTASSGDASKSLPSYYKALMLYRQIFDRRGEAEILDNLRRYWQEAKNPKLAVFYGKQSINIYQTLRSNISSFDKETRASYLRTVEANYRSVADLLIGLGRLPEAQQILDMLKGEEFFSFVQRDENAAGKASQQANLRPEEVQALEKYKAIADKLASVGTEFGKLQQLRNGLPEGTSLSPAEEQRYNVLAKQLEDANAAFQIFLEQLEKEFAGKKVASEVRENAGLQSELKAWGEGIVSLYTIVGDDRYRVILTTPEVQIDGKSEIKSVDLNRKISDFRAAIQNPRVDPRPLGKELYDIIIKPIEKQLEGAKTKTLLWSLDGTLRYVPLAALWDGKQYFGQKYENVVITLASRTRLSEDPRGDWRVLGLGVTEAKNVTEPNGTRVMKFGALPSVGTELKSIVRDEQTPTEQGVLAGKRLLDAEFTEQALKDRLGKGYRAIHIASHFSFRPGDMTKSFLLLGDGSALTLDKVKTSPQLKFGGVELLTLSACDTAVGESDANGKEIESFGVIAQQNGAKAVMATLWPVADESTSLFMSEFYRRKKENASLTKSEAIRQVQEAMINGQLKASGKTPTCRSEDFVEAPKETKFTCKADAPFSHPYFWSPFVLIGNWR